ncbi:MAG: PQQ-dependent sugar dehydrogenase [Saprospiraceae bacterium]
MFRNLVLSSIFLISYFLSAGQSNLKTRTVAKNLDTPWEILWGPDDHIWLTERLGKISRVNVASGTVSEVIQISEAKEVGEGGLLGLVLDPDFKTNSYFYVAYNYFATGNDYRERIVRFTFNVASGKAGEPFILLDNIDGANNHNGCRMTISKDKKLFLTTGDAQITSTSQNLNSINGKILRINLDGSIPNDNPKVGSPIWSWGHRNAQGLVFSPDGNILYSSEHGANSDDEINMISKGRNYGWPKVEGFCDNALETTFCKDSNVVEPLFAWTPTLGVAGIDLYDKNLITDWKNSLLVTSLKGSRVSQLQLSSDGKKILKATDYFLNNFGRLRDVCVSPDGKVYIAVSNKDGRGAPKSEDDKIIEIFPASTATFETKEGHLIAIYPNPSNGVLRISNNNADEEMAIYSIFSISGELVSSGTIAGNLAEIVLPKTYSGLAVLHLQIGNEHFFEKILIAQ